MKYLNALRKIYKNFFKTISFDGYTYKYTDFVSQEASDMIEKKLESKNPVMICRFGATELNYLINCLIHFNWHFSKYIKYIKNEIDSLDWSKSIIRDMNVISGFYPHTSDNAKRYLNLMISDIKEIDILGSWIEKEIFLKKELKNSVKVR